MDGRPEFKPNYNERYYDEVDSLFREWRRSVWDDSLGDVPQERQNQIGGVGWVEVLDPDTGDVIVEINQDGQTWVHNPLHENGGSDEISVAGLSGLLADPQTPLGHAVSHQDGGTDEVSVAGLSGLLATAQTPTAHAASHEDGGSDEVAVEDLPTAEVDTGKRLAPDGLGGVEWAAGAGGAVADLDDLTDVDVTTVAPADGEVLTFDTADSLWKPAPAGGAGSIDLDDLTDVDTTTDTPDDGDILVYDTADSLWKPAAPAASEGNVSTGNGAIILPELRDYHPAGTPIDFSAPDLDTGVTHTAVDDTAGYFLFPANDNSYVDVASAIGTGDFDIRARLLHVAVQSGAGNGALAFSVTDSARTAASKLSVKAYGHSPSSVVLYYIQQVNLTETGNAHRPLKYPCIVRISRVGTTVSFWVSMTEGRTWTLLSTNTSSINVGKIGFWGQSTAASTPFEVWVHWVRSV